MIDETLTEAEARRFYDGWGARLDQGEPFEGRAKRVAWELLGLRPGERALEVGVGTGRFLAHALAAVGPTGRVVGVDLSPTMLRLGRARAADRRRLAAGSRDAVAGEASAARRPGEEGDPAGGPGLVQASVLRLPVRDGAFDAVFSSYLLDLLPRRDLVPALRALGAALAPQGRLVLAGLTDGQTLAQRAVMGLWSRIHALAPARVGGCRPLVLTPFVEEAGLQVVTHRHVGQLGVPSEVLLVRRPR